MRADITPRVLYIMCLEFDSHSGEHSLIQCCTSHLRRKRSDSCPEGRHVLYSEYIWQPLLIGVKVTSALLSLMTPNYTPYGNYSLTGVYILIHLQYIYELKFLSLHLVRGGQHKFYSSEMLCLVLWCTKLNPKLQEVLLGEVTALFSCLSFT